MPVSRSISASSSMKRKPRSVASRLPERGLACAAQSDQGDPVAPRGFFLAVVAHQPEDHVFEPVARQLLEDAPHQPLLDRLLGPDAQQLGQRQPECVADVAQQHDRDVALAGLEVGEMAFRHPRLACQLLAGLAAPVRVSRTRLPSARRNSPSLRGSCRMPGCASAAGASDVSRVRCSSFMTGRESRIRVYRAAGDSLSTRKHPQRPMQLAGEGLQHSPICSILHFR
jgi:hypothetical protein